MTLEQSRLLTSESLVKLDGTSILRLRPPVLLFREGVFAFYGAQQPVIMQYG